MNVFIVLLVGISLVGARNNDKYSGYSVYGVQLRERSDQVVINHLRQTLDVDLWDHGAPGVRDAYIMVSPENKIKVLNILNENNMMHHLHLADVAKALDKNEVEISNWRQNRQNAPHQNYLRHTEINAYMELIATQYPGIVTLVTAGNSFDGREIKYLKISTSNFTDSSKPIYFMDAAMHAREWVTPPVTIYSIYRLVENLREEDKDLLENIDWIIMPVVNPDGYEYSHTDDRLWRRTRSFNATRSPDCWGVDPNRNFDINFNTIGVSSNPCSQIFPGHEPFSEPETRYIRDILWEYIDRIQIYMNIHSYGNYVVYGYDNATLPDNVLDLHFVASAMGAAIDPAKLPKAPFYLVGNANLLMYGTSGTAQDYAQAAGVPLSYTLELPGYEYNFEVPPQYIDQMNEETWRGLAASARMSRLFYNARIRR